MTTSGAVTINASLTVTVIVALEGKYLSLPAKRTVTVALPSGSTTTLTKDTDYTVAYTNNTVAGTATVTVTGKGNYKDTKSANFTISKAPTPTAPTAKTEFFYS